MAFWNLLTSELAVVGAVDAGASALPASELFRSVIVSCGSGDPWEYYRGRREAQCCGVVDINLAGVVLVVVGRS
jgi:hypothetical protein